MKHLIVNYILLLITMVLCQVNAQQSSGCTFVEEGKVAWTVRQAMSCMDMTFMEVLIFVGSLTQQERQWLASCAESAEHHQKDCFNLMESLVQTAATHQRSLPGRLVQTLYDSPPDVITCLAGINQGRDVGPFGPSCEEGNTLAQFLRASARLMPYITQIQPWRYPPAIQGCSATDILNTELSFSPFIDCMNLNFTSIAEAFSSDTTSGRQVTDSTIRASISCLYKPHFNNTDCIYLVILASTIDTGSWSDVIPYVISAVTNYPQACRCVRGIEQMPAFQAVPPTCTARQLLSLLTGLQATCNYEPQVQAAIGEALGGCTDGDVIRSELLGLQLLDCVGATGGDVLGSTKALTPARIDMISRCMVYPSWQNKDCIILLGGLAKVAHSSPQSVEAQLMRQMAENGATFCQCVYNVSLSVPAQGIPPQCDSPFQGVQFLRQNRDYCLALAAVPPTLWSSIVARFGGSGGGSARVDTMQKEDVDINVQGDLLPQNRHLRSQ